MSKLKLASESGLTWRTIRKYATSPRLQRDDDERPEYLHRAGCNRRCNYECYGTLGFQIASDVQTQECYLGPEE